MFIKSTRLIKQRLIKCIVLHCCDISSAICYGYLRWLLIHQTCCYDALLCYQKCDDYKRNNINWYDLCQQKSFEPGIQTMIWLSHIYKECVVAFTMLEEDYLQSQLHAFWFFQL